MVVFLRSRKGAKNLTCAVADEFALSQWVKADWQCLLFSPACWCDETPRPIRRGQRYLCYVFDLRQRTSTEARGWRGVLDYTDWTGVASWPSRSALTPWLLRSGPWHTHCSALPPNKTVWWKDGAAPPQWTGPLPLCELKNVAQHSGAWRETAGGEVCSASGQMSTLPSEKRV